MSLESHLVELQKRHNALDTELHCETKHVSVDPIELKKLKKQKLKLKDEINRLSDASLSAH